MRTKLNGNSTSSVPLYHAKYLLKKHKKQPLGASTKNYTTNAEFTTSYSRYSKSKLNEKIYNVYEEECSEDENENKLTLDGKEEEDQEDQEDQEEQEEEEEVHSIHSFTADQHSSSTNAKEASSFDSTHKSLLQLDTYQELSDSDIDYSSDEDIDQICTTNLASSLKKNKPPLEKNHLPLMETIIEQAYPLSSSSSSSSSSSTQLKSKKLPLKEFNEAYQENEFFVPTSLEHSKISVNQLVSALNNETEFGLLKLQVDQLKKNHTHTQRLLAPLPDHVQAKIRRQTFFKDTKKQLHQYQPIMDQLRHTHQLPPTLISSTNIASSTLTSLMADPPSSSSSSSSSTLSNLDTQLKKLTQVQRGGPMEVITEGKEELNEIKFVDDHVSQPTLKSVVETSSTSTTSVSSSPMNSKLKRKKRIELRYLRELSLRQEEKLKRMAKIKSKTYRKILKRDQLYQKKKRLQMNLEEISPEKKKELQYQLECERAEQRLTLKKKNTWTDQLNLLTSTSTSSSSSTSLNVTAMQPPSSDEEDEMSPKEKKETIPKKGLFAMKFMRRDLEMESGGTSLKDPTSSDLSETTLVTSSTMFNDTSALLPGRRTVGAHASSTPKPATTTPSSSASSSLTSSSKLFSFAPIETPSPFTTTTTSTTMTTTTPPKATTQRKESTSESGFETPLFSQLPKNPTTSATWEASQTSRGQSSSSSSSSLPMLSLEIPSFENVETLSTSTLSKTEVAKLFELDHVVNEFETRKEQAAQETDTKKIDVTLPGWGTWSGAHAPPPRSKVYHVQPGLPRSFRKDHAHSHVIVHTHRFPRPLVPYMLPHVSASSHVATDPYEALVKPTLGKEWMTQHHLDSLKPTRLVPGIPLPTSLKASKFFLGKTQQPQQQQQQKGLPRHPSLLKKKGEIHSKKGSFLRPSSSVQKMKKSRPPHALKKSRKFTPSSYPSEFKK